MKKTVLLCLFVMLGFSACTRQAVTDAAQQGIPQSLYQASYQLFPTQNMWTFIKLDTRNGRLWQIQYSVQGDSRGEVVLSSLSLVPKEQESNGRFTLLPTQNMWTFILLDQQDGRAWQVQWSLEAENRGVVPINEEPSDNL